MAIFRVNKTSNYTIMSSVHFREKCMSLKAKGLLSLMLSLPDDWDYSIAGLVTLSKDGKDSVMNALDELESFGYLRRTKTTNAKGQFSGYDYDIFEMPNTEKPYAENPNTANPNAENPPQLRTKKPNTKKQNIEEQNNKKYYVEIVSYLNEKAGTAYRATTKATQQHINARLSENFTVDDFRKVIDNMCKKWKGTEMAEYLRPSTLFGPKFENYLNTPTGETPKGEPPKGSGKFDNLPGTQIV